MLHSTSSCCRRSPLLQLAVFSSRNGINSVNILAFHIIIGALTLSLADDAPEHLRSRIDPSLAMRADSIEVVYADGRFSHLEYGVTEQRKPSSRTEAIQIDRLELARTEPGPKPAPHRAIWMWDNRPARADAETLLSGLRGREVRRVYLQIGDSLDPLIPFLRRAAGEGMEIFALDGSPDHLEHPEQILARVRAVKEHNARNPDASFAGFQIDIEPHLKKDFRLRRDTYCRLFTDLLDRIAAVPGAALRLSTVIPFWYDTVPFEGSTLAWHLMRKSDEAVIMSYRTDAAEIEAIARDELLYGERLGKPVLLGLETGRIPDEHHAVFSRCSPDSPRAVTAAEAAWCRGTDYAVPGGRISFAGKDSAFRGILASALPYRSFAGWVIHSYETAPRQ